MNPNISTQRGVAIIGSVLLGISLFGFLAGGTKAYMTYQQRQEFSKRIEQVQEIAEKRRERAKEINSKDPVTAEVMRRQAQQLEKVANALQGGSDVVLRAEVRGQVIDITQGQLLGAIDEVVGRTTGIGPAVDVMKLVYERVNIDKQGKPEHEEYVRRISRPRVTTYNLYEEVLEDMLETIYEEELGGRYSDSDRVLDPEKMAVAQNRFRARMSELPHKTLSLESFQEAYNSVLGIEEEEEPVEEKPKPAEEEKPKPLIETGDKCIKQSKKCWSDLRNKYPPSETEKLMDDTEYMIGALAETSLCMEQLTECCGDKDIEWLYLEDGVTINYGKCK